MCSQKDKEYAERFWLCTQRICTHWPSSRTNYFKYVHLLGWATVVVRVKPRIYKRQIPHRTTQKRYAVRTFREFPSSPTYIGYHSRRMNYASGSLLYGCVQSYAVRSSTTYTFLCRCGRGNHLRQSYSLQRELTFLLRRHTTPPGLQLISTAVLHTFH